MALFRINVAFHDLKPNDIVKICGDFYVFDNSVRSIMDRSRRTTVFNDLSASANKIVLEMEELRCIDVYRWFHPRFDFKDCNTGLLIKYIAIPVPCQKRRRYIGEGVNLDLTTEEVGKILRYLSIQGIGPF